MGKCGHLVISILVRGHFWSFLKPVMIYGASNTNISREAEEDTLNLIEIIEEPSVVNLNDKPLEQTAKALTRYRFPIEDTRWLVSSELPALLQQNSTASH